MIRALALTVVVHGAACGPSALTLVTLNIANGAAHVYRTDEARARQAALLEATGAQLAALEEVDVDVERSGRIDTARAVAGLECTLSTPELSVDGVRRCVGNAGAVLFALAFRADDPFDAVDGVSFGIIDGDTSLNPISVDRGHDALYGNALVARGVAVGEAYAVGLPTDAAQPADEPLFAALARGDTVDNDAREALGAHNLALRTAPAIEPRVALVARISRAGTSRPLSLIATHLESQGSSALRLQQLARIVAIATAERAGPPARDVILLGDLNLSPDESAPPLEAAHFVRAAGSGIDQIWSDSDLAILSGGELATNGASDHAVLARATVR